MRVCSCVSVHVLVCRLASWQSCKRGAGSSILKSTATLVLVRNDRSLDSFHTCQSGLDGGIACFPISSLKHAFVVYSLITLRLRCSTHPHAGNIPLPGWAMALFGRLKQQPSLVGTLPLHVAPQPSLGAVCCATLALLRHLKLASTQSHLPVFSLTDWTTASSLFAAKDRRMGEGGAE